MMGTVTTISDTQCQLGEGAFWHPIRQQFFWFDILGCRLLTIEGGVERMWQFDEHVSAAGWIDERRLLIASETRLFAFDLETAAQEEICPLETENPVTRSNDGRADPWGGFWIGTMGKQAERGAGTIWRYYRGVLEPLVQDVSISNSICFAPDKSCAYFTDTMTRRVRRWALDPADGAPIGEAEVFLDLREEGLNPDGSVVDSEGYLWNAQWGASRIARYAPDGTFVSAVSFPAQQISCPGFGGADLQTLFVTSAAVELDGPDEGKTFAIQTDVAGQAEHQVIL